MKIVTKFNEKEIRVQDLIERLLIRHFMENE